jgi:hypothetical protein
MNRLRAEQFDQVPIESPIISLKRELLGTVGKVEEIEKERDIVSELAAKNKTAGVDAALIREKERQTSDPADPKSPFVYFVRLRLAEIFNLPDDNAIKFYSSTSGSPNKTVAERDYGVDGFFELDWKGKVLRVPIGITLQPRSNPNALIYDLTRDFPIHGRFEKGDKGRELVGLSDSERRFFRTTASDLASKVKRRFEELIKIVEEKEKK